MFYTKDKLVGKVVLLDGVDVTELGVYEADTVHGYVKVRRIRPGMKVNPRGREVFRKKGKVEVKDKPKPVSEFASMADNKPSLAEDKPKAKSSSKKAEEAK